MTQTEKKDYVKDLLEKEPTYTTKEGLTLPRTYNSVMADVELTIWKEKYSN